MSYTTQKQFTKSFNQGQLGELIIATYLNSMFRLKNITFNKSSNLQTLREWDLSGFIDGDLVKYEIKTDLYEYYKGVKTGNMFIETSCNKKPSGIKASKADYLVYYYPDLEIAYIMYKKTLLHWLELNWQTHMSSGGDSGVAFGYLIPRVEIERVGLFKTIEIPREIFGI